MSDHDAVLNEVADESDGASVFTGCASLSPQKPQVAPFRPPGRRERPCVQRKMVPAAVVACTSEFDGQEALVKRVSPRRHRATELLTPEEVHALSRIRVLVAAEQEDEQGRQADLDSRLVLIAGPPARQLGMPPAQAERKGFRRRVRAVRTDHVAAAATEAATAAGGGAEDQWSVTIRAPAPTTTGIDGRLVLARVPDETSGQTTVGKLPDLMAGRGRATSPRSLTPQEPLARSTSRGRCRSRTGSRILTCSTSASASADEGVQPESPDSSWRLGDMFKATKGTDSSKAQSRATVTHKHTRSVSMTYGDLSAGLFRAVPPRSALTCMELPRVVSFDDVVGEVVTREKLTVPSKHNRRRGSTASLSPSESGSCGTVGHRQPLARSTCNDDFSDTDSERSSCGSRCADLDERLLLLGNGVGPKPSAKVSTQHFVGN